MVNILNVCTRFLIISLKPFVLFECFLSLFFILSIFFQLGLQYISLSLSSRIKTQWLWNEKKECGQFKIVIGCNCCFNISVSHKQKTMITYSYSWKSLFLQMWLTSHNPTAVTQFSQIFRPKCCSLWKWTVHINISYTLLARLSRYNFVYGYERMPVRKLNWNMLKDTISQNPTLTSQRDIINTFAKVWVAIINSLLENVLDINMYIFCIYTLDIFSLYVLDININICIFFT